MDDDPVREGELRTSRERLERLYTQVQPGLVRYLSAFAPAYAEDIASVAWTEVLTALPRFNGTDDEFRRWLFVTARRRVIDHHRRGWRRLVVLREPDHADLAGRGTDDPAFEESAAVGGGRRTSSRACRETRRRSSCCGLSAGSRPPRWH